MLYLLIGHLGSGRHTVQSLLQSAEFESMQPIIQYTTRPRRSDEVSGDEFHFASQQEFMELQEHGYLIASRLETTTDGSWYYAISKEFLGRDKDYVTIVAPESIDAIVNHYGQNFVRVFLVSATHKTRLSRLVASLPNWSDCSELCTRYIKDLDDYADKRIANAVVLSNDGTLDQTKSNLHALLKRH